MMNFLSNMEILIIIFIGLNPNFKKTPLLNIIVF